MYKVSEKKLSELVVQHPHRIMFHVTENREIKYYDINVYKIIINFFFGNNTINIYIHSKVLKSLDQILKTRRV